MSEFTVCRTLDIHPALRYCLLLDDMRIAGGKPDYRGDNILISWRTKDTYGPVDAIKTENSQLVTEKAALERRIDELCAEVERLHADQAHWELGNCPNCPNVVNLQEALEQNSKLCAEVEALKRDEWSAGFSAGCEAVEAAYEDGKAHYEVENAKLRELVDELYPLADYGAMDASELDRSHDLMRELGIEVGA